MHMTNDHVHGTVLAGLSVGMASGVAWFANWFAGHIQTIDGLMYFGVLLVSLITAIAGLRKVRRSK